MLRIKLTKFIFLVNTYGFSVYRLGSLPDGTLFPRAIDMDWSSSSVFQTHSAIKEKIRDLREEMLHWQSELQRLERQYPDVASDGGNDTGGEDQPAS